MSHEILKTKNEISMVLRGRKSIAPIFFPFLTLGCGQPRPHPVQQVGIHGQGTFQGPFHWFPYMVK